MATQNVLVPLEDYNKILRDSEELANVKTLLETEFPDDTCQMIAVKSLLGIVEDETSDPTDPPTGGDVTP